MLDNSDMFEPNTYNLEPNTFSHLLNNQEQQQINWTNTNNNFNINNLDVQTNQPDMLNLFQLPKCSSSICFSNPSHMDQVQQVMYHDHHGALLGMHNSNSTNVGVTQNVPYIRELLNNGFSLNGCSTSIFGEMNLANNGGCDGILEFGKNGGNNKDNVKHFTPATEKDRRQQLTGKYEALKCLVPNHPGKTDRASVVGDAIRYIHELKGTVEELKHLVDKKRCNRGRKKKHKTEGDLTPDVQSIYTMSNGVVGETTHDQQAYKGNSSSSMRSSMAQRKSKHTEIDVRIIDDEVTIKLVQQKRINCLLLVSKVLDELQLDLHHVAGGLIGDFYSYLFNTKICEGSSVYATAIANKLIEVVDKQYAAIPVTSSY